jgi:hypothetical protein
VRRLAEGKPWSLLAFYGLGGLALGVADPWFGHWVRSAGWRPGLATAASVNVVLPLLAVGLAVAHRRLGVAWVGAVAMAAGFHLGLAVAYPKGHGWGVVELIRAVPPVLVLACAGYAVIGTLCVLGLRGLGAAHGLKPGTPAD